MKIILALLLVAASACAADFWTNQVEIRGLPRAIPATSTIQTNLPVTITILLTTNLVEGNNQSGCSTCEMLRAGFESGSVPAIYHPPHNAGPFKPATEKWEIANVTECTTFMIGWGDKLLVIPQERIISSTTNRWKLESEWKKMP